MATGALDVNGVWQYGEDDSETTFSALLNKLGSSVSGTMKGRIVQVVLGATSTQTSNATTTYIDTGLSATITPKNANNKIIGIVSQSGLYRSFGNGTTAIWLKAVKNTTDILVFNYALGYGDAQMNYLGSSSTSFLDIAGGTSPITYKTQFKNEAATGSVSVQMSGLATSTLTLIEVSA